MSLAETVQRTKFNNDTFAHLESLYRTSLWLTKRGSLAKDLIVTTMTVAYREWDFANILVSNKTRLFRVLSREFFGPGKQRRTEHPTGKFLPENNGHVADQKRESLQHSMSETETMQQLLKSDASSASVKGAIVRLRPKTRLIMVLLYRERFSYEEIAYITDLSKATVRTILTRLRKMIPGYILENTEHSNNTAANKNVFQPANATCDHAAHNVSPALLFGYNRRSLVDAAFQRWENEGGAVDELK